jgi:dolichol-phosphate mannosyltransferase
MYVFGGFGAAALALGVLAVLFMIYLKLVEGVSMISTPLPVFSAMCVLVGLMSLLMGLVAEIVVRTYFESQSRTSYAVREIVGRLAKP